MGEVLCPLARKGKRGRGRKEGGREKDKET